MKKLLQRFRDFWQRDNKKPALAAGAAAGVFGLITITTTQVVTPNAVDPPSDPEFPTISSVGPAVDPTITYTGDCTFGPADDNLVIDNRIVDCDDEGLRFSEGDYTVTFTDSIILGAMYTFQYTPDEEGSNDFPKDPVFIVQDSDIIQSNTLNGDRAVCCAHYVVERSYVQGTHSGAGGHNNVILNDNFITTDGTDSHSSGIRFLKNSTVHGNTITCKPVTPGSDGGCSAAGVFYSEAINGDPAAAFNLTITDNYFRRGFTSGGSPGGPWNATRFIDCRNRVDCVDITFTGNQFDVGWGTDADEFPISYGGNVWSGNYWADDSSSAESGEVR